MFIVTEYAALNVVCCICLVTSALFVEKAFKTFQQTANRQLLRVKPSVMEQSGSVGRVLDWGSKGC